MSRSGVRLLGLILVLIGAPGCESWSRVGARMGEDAFVVLASPLEIPVTAARDSIIAFESPGTAAAAFPLMFPFYIVEHALFTVIHAGDLVLFPFHFLHGSPSLEIYEGIDMPLEKDYMAENISQGIGITIVFVAAIAIPIIISASI